MKFQVFEGSPLRPRSKASRDVLAWRETPAKKNFPKEKEGSLPYPSEHAGPDPKQVSEAGSDPASSSRPVRPAATPQGPEDPSSGPSGSEPSASGLPFSFLKEIGDPTESLWEPTEEKSSDESTQPHTEETPPEPLERKKEELSQDAPDDPSSQAAEEAKSLAAESSLPKESALEEGSSAPVPEGSETFSNGLAWLFQEKKLSTRLSLKDRAFRTRRRLRSKRKKYLRALALGYQKVLGKGGALGSSLLQSLARASQWSARVLDRGRQVGGGAFSLLARLAVVVVPGRGLFFFWLTVACAALWYSALSRWSILVRDPAFWESRGRIERELACLRDVQRTVALANRLRHLFSHKPHPVPYLSAALFCRVSGLALDRLEFSQPLHGPGSLRLVLDTERTPGLPAVGTYAAMVMSGYQKLTGRKLRLDLESVTVPRGDPNDLKVLGAVLSAKLLQE